MSDLIKKWIIMTVAVVVLGIIVYINNSRHNNMPNEKALDCLAGDTLADVEGLPDTVNVFIDFSASMQGCVNAPNQPWLNDLSKIISSLNTQKHYYSFGDQITDYGCETKDIVGYYGNKSSYLSPFCGICTIIVFRLTMLFLPVLLSGKGVGQLKSEGRSLIGRGGGL